MMIFYDDPERLRLTNAKQRRALRRHSKRWNASIKWADHPNGGKSGSFPGGVIYCSAWSQDSLATRAAKLRQPP